MCGLTEKAKSVLTSDEINSMSDIVLSRNGFIRSMVWSLL